MKFTETKTFCLSLMTNVWHSIRTTNLMRRNGSIGPILCNTLLGNLPHGRLDTLMAMMPSPDPLPSSFNTSMTMEQEWQKQGQARAPLIFCLQTTTHTASYTGAALLSSFLFQSFGPTTRGSFQELQPWMRKLWRWQKNYWQKLSQPMTGQINGTKLSKAMNASISWMIIMAVKTTLKTMEVINSEW